MIDPQLDTEIRRALTDVQATALTMWAEARASFNGRKWVKNPPEALGHIGYVIVNRVLDPRWARQHATPKDICHQRWQFSCWEPGGGLENYTALLHHAKDIVDGELPDDDQLRLCLTLAAIVLGDDASNPIPLATHYYATWMPKAPSWSLPPAVLVLDAHGHRFYSHVR